MARQDTAEFISNHAENFDGLPMGYMPVIIIAVVIITCLLGLAIVRRNIKDHDGR